MNVDLIGTYIDRPILLQEASSFSELAIDDLSHAVVLLWLDEGSWDPKQLELAVRRLAANNVLNITIAGEKSDEGFSVLLETLGSLSLDKHIMTGIFSGTDVKAPLKVKDALIVKDAVERFLISTWPTEERFDEWREYRIIIVGKPNLSRQIRDSVREITERVGKGHPLRRPLPDS